MKIHAKIDRLVNGGATKAIASITLDNWYVVKGLRVVDGKKGLFVSMPQESYTDKGGEKKYSNIFFPHHQRRQDGAAGRSPESLRPVPGPAA